MDETLWALTDPYTCLEHLKVISEVTDEKFVDVLDRYGQIHRHYHGLYHIAFLYALHDDLCFQNDALFLKNRLKDVCRAILYHDAIYDPTSKTNEYDSAQLWVAHGGSPDDWVYSAIMATAAHLTERPVENDDDRLREWFVGLDLASLAAPTEIFTLNNKLIRLEFGHISDQQWKGGRTSFIESLSGGIIYRDPFLHGLFEDRAHANITRLLSKGV
jgi:predicted metal-dependent HD superfamily phosphohydrolase